MRLIDADALMDKLLLTAVIADDKGVEEEYYFSKDLIQKAPTIDAVPVEFVMDNYNSEFVCDALTDDGDWCSEHCEFSEAQPECIHRYIERIWSAERKEDA